MWNLNGKKALVTRWKTGWFSLTSISSNSMTFWHRFFKSCTQRARRAGEKNNRTTIQRERKNREKLHWGLASVKVQSKVPAKVPCNSLLWPNCARQAAIFCFAPPFHCARERCRCCWVVRLPFLFGPCFGRFVVSTESWIRSCWSILGFVGRGWGHWWVVVVVVVVPKEIRLAITNNNH